MKPRLFKTVAGMQAFMAAQRGGRAFHMLVLHDEGCSPSRCTCHPWYEVRDLTADSVIEGARLTERWIRESAS